MAGDFETVKPGDPADKTTNHRAGALSLWWLLDYFTRHPDATATSGEAGRLAARVRELEEVVEFAYRHIGSGRDWEVYERLKAVRRGR